MCECTAHLFFSRSVGGHTQRAPPGANLLPALLTPPSQRDCTGTFLPQGESHQHWLCTNLSSQASVGIQTHKCLPGHLFRSRTDVVCWELASETLEKRGTFCRSTYTGCECCKNCTWICLSPKFPCRQVLLKFLELHCVTIMQVKEEKSA